MTTLQYSISGSPFESATPSKAGLRLDLTTFLGVAQQYGIDFLPITWQPALDQIGRGATAEIRQNPMNLQTSFAFKRPLFTSSYNTDESEDRILPSLIAEISILGSPAIRRHANIVHLEGICWDVISKEGHNGSRKEPILEGEGGIVPVLIFEKTVHGDLQRFMTHGAGGQLSFLERLKLCSEIAKAVAEMHSHRMLPFPISWNLINHDGLGIIHGDIKPQNVLVFEDSPAKYTPRVADFGYSTQYAAPSDLVLMPMSRPWVAPEWHHRGVTPQQATKMDAFSFGMLVLWVLRQKEVDRQFAEFGRIFGALSLARRICESVRIDSSADLLQFFNVTLTDDVTRRSSDFNHLYSLLASKQFAAKTHEQQFPVLSVQAINFQIISSMRQFYPLDYRVRLHVARVFIKRMTHDLILFEDEDLRAKHRLLQCAFCYEIGFGVARDPKKSRQILKKIKEHRLDFYLELILLRLEERKPDLGNSTYDTLDREGQAQKIHIEDTLAPNHGQENIELEYRDEIADVAAALGDTHTLVTVLKSQLAAILRRRGLYEKAEKLSLEVVQTEYSKTKNYSTLLTEYHNAALTLIFQEKWEAAAEMQIIVVERRKQMSGEEHPDTLKDVLLLAQIYEKQERWEEAEEMATHVLAKMKAIYGEDHHETLVSMMTVASTAWTLGRADAEELRVKATRVARRILGVDHLATTASMSCLADIYIYQSRWAEAEELATQVLAVQEKLLSKEHKDTLISILRLARIYQGETRYEEAEVLLSNVIPSMTRVLGEGRGHTLRALEVLADNHWAQDRKLEAEILDLQVIESSFKELGAYHPHTLERMARLSLRIADRLDAERLQWHVIWGSITLLSEKHPGCGFTWPCDTSRCSVMKVLYSIMGSEGGG